MSTQQNISQDEAIMALNSYLMAYELVMCFDSLKHTTLYNHDLRQKLNMVLKPLEKYADKIDEVSGIDDNVLNQLMLTRKEVLAQLFKLRPEFIEPFSLLINEFFNQPELTLHRLGIIAKTT